MNEGWKHVRIKGKNRYRDDCTSTQIAKARFIGAASAGMFEILVFHPVDTIAKRLMSHQQRVTFKLNVSGGATFSDVVFRQASGSSALSKWKALFPGIGWALSYKITQRIFKWGGQPWLEDIIERNFASQFESTFGDFSKPMMAGTAGAIVGASEVSFLPLDVLKIKSQTNPDALAQLKVTLRDSRRQHGTLSFLRGTGRNVLPGLYHGAVWTALRNSTGTFVLFGASSFYMKKRYGRTDKTELTLSQYFSAATFASILTIMVSNPIDVIKTRCQNKDFRAKVSGVQIGRDLLAREGYSAFLKGIVPKLLTVGPKLVTSFAISQYLIQCLERHYAEQNNL